MAWIDELKWYIIDVIDYHANLQKGFAGLGLQYI